jgi:ubiquinone/menaquinone biosynthesis C-methylase UbiE
MKIIADPVFYKEKEDLYINVRTAEARVTGNEVLKMLPFLPEGYAHKNEWDIRAENFHQLIKYIQKKFNGRPIHILDIGCGNGWMSHRLSTEGHFVTGLDLNLVELKQAEEVFGESPKLQWVYANILEDRLGSNYDLIIFSASCQYFQNLETLVNTVKALLKLGGEIHFHDSIFYTEAEQEQAKKRSIDYYTQLGFPQMATYYFHHSKNTLIHLGFKNMHSNGLFSKKCILEWWAKNSTDY